MIPFELFAMGICFAGMVTITVSGSMRAEKEEAAGTVDESSPQYTGTSLIIGYCIIFATAWVYAANCVLNRALKGINSGVIMFWHGILGITLASIAVGIDFGINDAGTGNGVQLFNYSKEVYGLMLAATLFDTLGVNAVTIAFQSDSSGFVSLISYINVIYAFLADCLIFNESFGWVELLAASIVLIITVVTSVVKLRESQKANRYSRADSFTSAEDLNRSICRAD